MTDTDVTTPKPSTRLAHALYGVLMLLWIIAGVTWVMSVESNDAGLLLVPKICITMSIAVVAAIGFLVRDPE